MRLHQRYEVYSAKLSGRESQSDGPVTEKTCGPNRLSRYRGTIKRRRVADWRCCRAETSDRGTQRSARYCGDWPCKQLYIATPSLYWTLSGTSSQWSSECRSRDKPWSYLWVLDSTRAAAFITRCKLSVTTFGAPANKMLQWSTRDDTNAWTSVVAEDWIWLDQDFRKLCGLHWIRSITSTLTN